MRTLHCASMLPHHHSFWQHLPSLADLNGFLMWLFVGTQQVAAWGALVSLGVLYYYTRYTRRMMLATEATMRAQQRPLVQVLYVERSAERVLVTIRNSGQGPGLNLSRWIAKRSTSANAIPRRPGFIAPSNYREEHSFLEVLASKSQEEIEFTFRLTPGCPWEDVLLVIHAEDVSGNRYQTAVKLRMQDGADRVVWQSLSEQLFDEHKEENAFVQWLMRAKRKIEHTVKQTTFPQ